MGKPNVNVIIGAYQKVESTYKKIILKGGMPFAPQLSDGNCIYVIKYDFDLGGEEVTIPAGSILDFDGGSLKNGKLVLDDTTLDGNVIFGSDLDVSGTFTNQDIYQKWFENNDVDGFFNMINNTLPVGDSVIYNFEAGIYHPKVRVNKTSAKNVTVKGNGAKLIYSSSTVIAGSYMFHFSYEQSDTTRHYLRTAASPTTGRIELKDIDGLSVGDYVTIRDSTLCSYSYYRDYQDGEFFKIRMFSGNTENAIVPDNYLYGHYSHIDNEESYVVKTDFGKFAISDISFILDENLAATFDSRCLTLRFFRVSMNNVEIQKFRYCTRLAYCIDSRISNCVINSNPITASRIDNYGLFITNCQNINVDGGDYRGGNHGISLGGGTNGDYTIVNRFVNISNVYAYSYRDRFGIEAHGNSEYCTYTNNYTDGIVPGANHCVVTGNVCTKSMEQSEILGLDFIISNNIIGERIKFDLNHSKRAAATYDNYTVPNNNTMVISNNKVAECIINITQDQRLTENHIDSCKVLFNDNVIRSGVLCKMVMYDDEGDVMEDADYLVSFTGNTFNEILTYASTVPNYLINAPVVGFYGNYDLGNIYTSAKRMYIENNVVRKNLNHYSFFIQPVGVGMKGIYVFEEAFVTGNVTVNNFIYLIDIATTEFKLYCKDNTVLDGARFLGLNAVEAGTPIYYTIYWDNNNVVSGRYCSSPSVPAETHIIRAYDDNEYAQYTSDKDSPVGLGIYKYRTTNNPLAYKDAFGVTIPTSPMRGITLQAGCDCFAVPYDNAEGNYLDCLLAIRNGNKSAIIHITNLGGSARADMVSANGAFRSAITYNVSFKRDSTARIFYIKLSNLRGDGSYPFVTLYDINTKYTGTSFVRCVDSTEMEGFTDVKIYSYDGAAYNVAKSGLKSERPTGSDIYVGFCYLQIDAENGTKPIWASAINGETVTWVNASGEVEA